MKPRPSYIILFFLCFIITAPALAESFSGKVLGVLDEDTIKVMWSRRAVKVRLEGIDCPEKWPSFGVKAKDRLLTAKGVFTKAEILAEAGWDKRG